VTQVQRFLLNAQILKRGYGSILPDIFTKPMVLVEKKAMVYWKIEEIVVFGGQDGKAIPEDGAFAAV
jgi:hypothetical protein